MTTKIYRLEPELRQEETAQQVITKNLQSQRDQYFERVKSIYQGKIRRVRYSQNSQYTYRNASHQQEHKSNINNPEKPKAGYTVSISGVHLLNQSANQPSSIANSKMCTQNEEPSPKKRFFHNKVEKQKMFRNQCQNDRMLKRLYQIKNRKNRYMKECQDLMQFEKQHKQMHEKSVLANKRLLEIEIEQKNNKLIDCLLERVKYKQTIKPVTNQKLIKSIKLDDSRARVALGSRVAVQLPPMVFD